LKFELFRQSLMIPGLRSRSPQCRSWIICKEPELEIRLEFRAGAGGIITCEVAPSTGPLLDNNGFAKFTESLNLRCQNSAFIAQPCAIVPSYDTKLLKWISNVSVVQSSLRLLYGSWTSGVTKGKGRHMPQGAAFCGRQIEVGILRNNFEMSNASGC